MSSPKEVQEAASFKEVFLDYAKSIVIALIIALVVRTFIVQAFRIPSGSMIPTLLVGDHILVNKFIYHFKDPQHGDVVVFKFPLDPKKDYIKRIIGIPGDRIEIRDKVVYRNGKPLKEPYAIHEDNRTLPAAFQPRDNFGPVVVPPNSYFMMGDNRDHSNDSRFWGIVPYRLIVGKPWFIYFSWDENYTIRWDRIGRDVETLEREEPRYVE